MNAIAELQPPRLPYHAAVQDRFNIDRSGWKALVEAVYPLAKTPDAVIMALSYCKARKLDPFKRPVHIVPMWDAKAGNDGNGGYVETVWPGISEIRTTAFRTAQYAGCEETEFGPTVSHTFVGTKDRWENRKRVGTEQIEVKVTFPEWARITVLRDMNGRTCRFVGPKVYWAESYASQGKLDVPNSMWADRPIGQLEKCAEAAALRKAVPDELGNELTAEEMHGKRVEGDFGGAEITEPVKRQPSAPPKDMAAIEDATVVVEKAATRREPPKPPAGKPAETKAEAAKVTSGRQKAQQQDQGDKQTADYDGAPVLAEIQKMFDQIDSVDALDAYTGGKGRGLVLYDSLSRSDQEDANHRYQQAKARIEAADAAAERAENEKTGAEAGDPLGPDERGHPDDNDDAGDQPSTAAAAEKKPEKMDAAELDAHIRGYIETMTDADALKKRWYADDELREILDDKARQALRGLWKARMDELRAVEGQG